MGKVSAGATMSLDGFIAGPEDTGFDLLFKWYGAGDVEVPMPDSTAGVPASHVAFAYAFQHPNLASVVFGSSRPEQLDENVAALTAYMRTL